MKNILRIIGKNILAFIISFVALIVAMVIIPDYIGTLLIVWFLFIVGFLVYSIKSTYNNPNEPTKQSSSNIKPSPTQKEYDMLDVLDTWDNLIPTPTFTEELNPKIDYSGNVGRKTYIDLKNMLFGGNTNDWVDRDKYPDKKWWKLGTIDYNFMIFNIEKNNKIHSYSLYIFPTDSKKKETVVFFKNRDIKIKENELKIKLRDETKWGSITIQYDYENEYKNVFVVKFKGWGMDFCKRGIVIRDTL